MTMLLRVSPTCLMVILRRSIEPIKIHLFRVMNAGGVELYILDDSRSGQRVLLHRARPKVRQALAPYMDEPKPNASRPSAHKSCA